VIHTHESVPPDQTQDSGNPETPDPSTQVEKVYSTKQAAQFFGKSVQWIYWGLRNNIFTYEDGTQIQPERVGKVGKRRFTLPILREMAKSSYRRGNMKEDELKMILQKLSTGEHEDL
jgi:hypothetical protein